MATYLITGCSRGLGLALTSLIAAEGSDKVGKVFATARNESDGLKKVVSESPDRIEFVQLDVSSEESVNNAASKVEKSLNGRGLDVVINNAGVMPYTAGGVQMMTDLDETFKTDVTSVHYVTKAFLPLLKKGQLKKIVNVSTTLGSIAKSPVYKDFPFPAYKVAKAALNMLTVQYSQDLANEGFTVVALSPGWVQTDLGTAAADLTVEQGSKATRDIILKVSKDDTGKFYNVHVSGWEDAKGPNQYDGKTIPW